MCVCVFFSLITNNCTYDLNWSRLFVSLMLFYVSFMIFLWFWHSFRFNIADCRLPSIGHRKLTDREMVLLMLSPCSIRSCDSLLIVHTMIASDGECIEDDCIPQVRLELMYPTNRKRRRRKSKKQIVSLVVCLLSFRLLYKFQLIDLSSKFLYFKWQMKRNEKKKNKSHST